MTDTLKNLTSSVDWKKMLSSSDAKNALIGSALGGLVLGGASLMSDRDPEESKLAPVGDALTGALLGGIAGYGIPKGLALFRDSGTLAPDNDQLPSSHYGKSMLQGAGFGVGAYGTAAGGKSIAKYIEAMHKRDAKAAPVILKRIRQRRAAEEAGRLSDVAKLTKKIKRLERAPKLKSVFPLDAPKQRMLWGIGPKVGRLSRLGGRAGAVGVAGAGLAALLHGLTGPSSTNNFSN